MTLTDCCAKQADRDPREADQHLPPPQTAPTSSDSNALLRRRGEMKALQLPLWQDNSTSGNSRHRIRALSAFFRPAPGSFWAARVEVPTVAVYIRHVPLLLIHATGPDKPGILEALTGSLNGSNTRVLDVGQAVIHRTLTLGLLVQVSDSTDNMKEVLFAGHALGLSVNITPVREEAYEDWVARQGEERHIITLFGPCITAEHLERIGNITTEYGLSISVVTRLSGRTSLKQPCDSANTCIELSVRGTPIDASALRRAVLVSAQELNCDIAIQVDDVFRRNRRMIAFDMDSTLVQGEGIDELARVHGVVDEVAKITAAAMNGELDFDQSLRRRLSLLRGLRTEVMAEIAERLPLTDGAERLIRTVKSLGYKTAILSGGFTFFGKHLQQKLGIDHVFANTLEEDAGQLTGNVIGPIVNGQRKADLLRQIATKENIRLEQVIAVGDGANDLPMLNAAGLGIAFHAKPKVKESAKQQISATGLDGILYLIGVRDREVPAPSRQPAAEGSLEGH